MTPCYCDDSIFYNMPRTGARTWPPSEAEVHEAARRAAAAECVRPAAAAPAAVAAAAAAALPAAEPAVAPAPRALLSPTREAAVVLSTRPSPLDRARRRRRRRP